MSGWQSATWAIPGTLVDSISDWLMFEMNALSVTTEDADAGTDRETPQFDEPDQKTKNSPWSHNRLTALFEEKTDINTIHTALQQVFGELPLVDQTYVAPDDWVSKTQAQFAPIAVSERLWIVPSWHDVPDEMAINIRLDPGMAFGTGSHPTTRLCLSWLEKQCFVDGSVLDYGCGSGILAIAAAKLGAGLVVGVDIDSQAVESADKNAKNNQVTCQFMLPDTFHRQYGNVCFDIVIANILTNPLKILAPTLARCVAAEGTLVLSGILAEQADDVIGAYAPWIELSIDAVDDGWVRLVGQNCRR